MKQIKIKIKRKINTKKERTETTIQGYLYQKYLILLEESVNFDGTHRWVGHVQ